MFIKREKLQYKNKIIIDLLSPQGNAFYIMGVVEQLAKQIGYTKEEVKKLKDDLTSSDYEHLLNVVEENFGDFIIFIK